jgi:hypothetical protein
MAAANKKSSTFKNFKKDEVIGALEEENKRLANKQRPAASATYYKGPGIISSQNQPKQ